MKDVHSELPRKSFSFTKEGMTKLRHRLNAVLKQKTELSVSLRKRDDIERADAITSSEHISKIELAEAEATRLKAILQRAKLITNMKKSKTVRTGSKITLKTDHETFTYTLVCPPEVDPSMNKISDESPLGQALFGKKLGQKLEITTPKGKICRYEIIAVE